VAETDCEVAPVDARCFEFMVCETPFFALALMRVMSRRLRAMNTRGLGAEGT
jgi:CRP/FNR family transcriptional regulator, cyclic AMP receptor protein